MRVRFTLSSFTHRIFLAAIVVALCLAPLTLVRVVGFLLAAGVLPGCALAARSRFRCIETIGLGTAISPVLFGMVAMLAWWMHASAVVAAWVAVGACLVLFVFFWRGRADNASPSFDRRALIGLAIIIGIAAVMSFALPLSSSWWRTRDDSWWHAAVTGKLLRDGVPLTDPYFAGLRLQYMYFYHGILGACVSLVRVDAFFAMIIVNVIALISCATAFHALAGLFARRVGPRLLATALWLFGMNGWFYLFYVLRAARALIGETQGAPVWQRLFPWDPNGHATAMSLISVEGNQFMFLDKFMLGTAFSLTFALAAGVLLLFLSARRGGWSLRHDLVLVLCTAGMMWLHPVTGITVSAVTAAVLALLLLVRSQTARGGPSYARLVAWIAVGIAVTVPYLRSVTPRGGAPTGFGFQPDVALGLFAAILPGLLFVVWYFARARDDKDTPERFGARPVMELTLSGSGLVAMWFGFMAVVSLVVDLAVNNETKFAYLLWLPVCTLAAGCFELWWDSPRRRTVAWVLVLSATLPLHMLYYHHAVRDHSALEIRDQERAVYQWIEKSTPRDAVFIEENDIVRVPVLANRDLYWGTETYARQWGYPRAEMSARRDLRDHVFSKEGISADDVMQLRVLGRRVFVIYRMKDDELINAPERFENRGLLRGKFATTEVAVWEVILD